METKDYLSGKKILFVEDDIFFADMISAKLSTMKCVLFGAASGEQALATLEKERPDLIILDLLLPGKMDGFSILENIKNNSNFKDTPVVILSNLGRAEDIEKGMRLGAFRYLTKALVSPSEIVENLGLALNAKKIESSEVLII